MSELELDPPLLETLRTLQQHDVEFVLVGDVAEAIYNNGGFVSGVAIVPGAYGRNVERLNAALQAMDARARASPAPPPRRTSTTAACDLRELAPCSFMTRYVDVDLNFEPLGTRGYRDLFDEAKHVELAPAVSPLVAAAEDLERIGRSSRARRRPTRSRPRRCRPSPTTSSYSPADDIRASRSSALEPLSRASRTSARRAWPSAGRARARGHARARRR